MQPNFWQLNNIYKKTQLSQLLEIFVPHSTLTPFLYYEFIEQILCNYKHRNPFSANQNRLTMTIAEKVKEEDYLPVLSNIPGITTAQSSLISGASGVGKTLTIRNILLYTAKCQCRVYTLLIFSYMGYGCFHMQRY